MNSTEQQTAYESGLFKQAIVNLRGSLHKAFNAIDKSNVTVYELSLEVEKLKARVSELEKNKSR